MPNDLETELGREFQLRADPMPHWNGIVACQVLEIEHEKRLVWSWHTEGPDGRPGLRTTVEFTLDHDTVTGTLLRVEQRGFRADQPANLRGAQMGWARNLGRLEVALRELPQDR